MWAKSDGNALLWRKRCEGIKYTSANSSSSVVVQKLALNYTHVIRDAFLREWCCKMLSLDWLFSVDEAFGVHCIFSQPTHTHKCVSTDTTFVSRCGSFHDEISQIFFGALPKNVELPGYLWTLQDESTTLNKLRADGGSALDVAWVRRLGETFGKHWFA